MVIVRVWQLLSMMSISVQDVHAVFLDTAKAFDTVWHDGLKYKLYEIGVNGRLWCVIDQMYSGLTSFVQIGSSKSRPFAMRQGVRQGGILSAKLYLLYVNGLLDKLSNTKKGCMVLDLNACSPTQADDVAILSSSTQGLKCMLDMCEQYSSDWRFTLSAQKSEVMTFPYRTKPSTQLGQLTLYRDIIPHMEVVKHVGIILTACMSAI